jgi:hypothetical protein
VIQFPVTWLYTLHNIEVHIWEGLFGRNFHYNGLSVTSLKKTIQMIQSSKKKTIFFLLDFIVWIIFFKLVTLKH